MDEELLKKFNTPEDCPVRNVISRIGDKWSILILLLLDSGKVLRFNEIHKYIGTISQKMLTETLKSLGADGLIKRKVYPEIPPRVEYSLTARGQSLIPHLHSLVNWANLNMDNIMASRYQFEKSRN